MKTILLTTTIALAVAASTQDNAAKCKRNGMYPDIAETQYASSQAVSLFHTLFTSKSSGNITGELSVYSNDPATDYYDSTLGIAIGRNRSNLAANLTAFEDHFYKTGCNGQSYPLRILGDTVGGALVYFVNTPALLGAEVRTITSFDFLNGLVRRQCDNWDGRDNLVTTLLPRTGPYPTELGLAGVAELAAPQMQKVAHNLNAALSSGNVTAAVALFSYNAIFEDLTLRAEIQGVIQLRLYLQRAIHLLPYGAGTKVFHVLGSATGGGYEWTPTDGVLHGITALELNSDGLITRLTAVWDGARLDTTVLHELTRRVLDPPLKQ